MTQWNWSKPLVVCCLAAAAVRFHFRRRHLTKVADGGWIRCHGRVPVRCVLDVRSGAQSSERARRNGCANHQGDTLLEGVQRAGHGRLYLASDPDVVPSALIRNLRAQPRGA